MDLKFPHPRSVLFRHLNVHPVGGESDGRDASLADVFDRKTDMQEVYLCRNAWQPNATNYAGSKSWPGGMRHAQSLTELHLGFFFARNFNKLCMGVDKSSDLTRRYRERARIISNHNLLVSDDLRCDHKKTRQM